MSSMIIIIVIIFVTLKSVKLNIYVERNRIYVVAIILFIIIDLSFVSRFIHIFLTFHLINP